MKSVKHIAKLALELLKKYPSARLLVLAGFVVLFIALSSFSNHPHSKRPVIESINPPLGSAGDTIILKGKNFGIDRVYSYVEIAGSRITSSGYIEWTDSQIKVLLPPSVSDGLVIVGTSGGRSQPLFFAKSSGIPVAVKQTPQTTQPLISSIQPKEAPPGGLIVINGANFGNIRGTSQVCFSTGHSSAAGVPVYIAANEMDYDYEFWSDSELHVRVPDGAFSGSVYIQTEHGNSQNSNFSVAYAAGKNSYTEGRTYVVQVNADIQNRSEGQDSRITLYMPRPPVCASQPSVAITEISPEPLIANDIHDIIQQTDVTSLKNSKQRFSQTFAVSVYGISSTIDSRKVKRYSDTSRLLYSMFTASDSCVPSNNPLVIQLKDSIVARERNPYRQAKLFYDYMIQNYVVNEQVRLGNISVLDLIEQKYGDAYDFAILFTALCRAAGIPSLPVSGILVDGSATTRNHWWSEIYFEGYGWFPVDVALGAGLEFNPQRQIQDKAEFYFGNMDEQHIIFSRGWTQIKPSVLNSKIVYRPRTYALQSVWEEASDSDLNYSSLWNNPTIIGIE